MTADALAAETARRLNRSNERMSLALDRVRRDLQRTNRKLRHARADAAAAADAVLEPEQTPASDRDASGTPWLPYAGWFIAGAAVSFMFVRRRREAPRPDLIIERVPDDARELKDPLGAATPGTASDRRADGNAYLIGLTSNNLATCGDERSRSRTTWRSCC